MTHGVFDVIAKDPQVEHVPTQVHEASVKEHGGEESKPGAIKRNMGGESVEAEPSRNRAIGEDEALLHRGREEDLVGKNGDVGGEDQVRRHRNCVTRVFISQRDHFSSHRTRGAWSLTRESGLVLDTAGARDYSKCRFFRGLAEG